MTILITGSAGFIGYHLTKKLLKSKIKIIGIDNLNSYYDIKLKKARLEDLKKLSKRENVDFIFFQENIENYEEIEKIFKKFNPTKVVNLAAQAGVRYSLINPSAYIKANIEGFSNILELSKHYSIKHLIFASSSSVYGGNKKLPFNENDNIDHPVSLYAATKKANELMAHSYSHLYKLPVTGLRFFTVYGPWGRPDMALFLFTEAILNKKEIHIYNNGKMTRDFTYIDDIIESLTRIIEKIPSSNENFDFMHPSPSESWSPYKIFNIGNSSPTQLLDYINAIEEATGLKSIRKFMPMQPGDVENTSADTNKLEGWINFKPNTSIREGVKKFVEWYKDYYGLK